MDESCMYVTSCMDMTSQEVPGGSQGARRSVRTTGEVHLAHFSFFPPPLPTFFCFYSPTAGRTLPSQTSADRGQRDADIGDEKMIKSLRFLKDATTLTLRAQGPQGQRCQHVNVHRQNRAITTAITIVSVASTVHITARGSIAITVHTITAPSVKLGFV